METWYVWKFSEERQVSSASSSQKGSPNHAKQNKYFKRSRHWNRWMGPLFRHGFANLVVKVWQVNVWRTCHFLKQKIVLGQVHGVVNSKNFTAQNSACTPPQTADKVNPKTQNISIKDDPQKRVWVTLSVGMCQVCTEAIHSVALWTRVSTRCGHVWSMYRGSPFTGINKVRTCVKYVPRQSIP